MTVAASRTPRRCQAGISKMVSCIKCQINAPDEIRYCPSCKRDLGAPNVRAAETSAERDALAKRVDSALARAKTEKRLPTVMSFRRSVDRESHVVVNMAPSFARSLVEDRRKVYANYEKLVGAELRTPATGADDRRRCAVDGWFFGSFGIKIVFGVLSLSSDGLPTYGNVACRLRDEAIDDRTSFLETNSYKFATIHKVQLADVTVPAGYRATWNTRADLALARIGDRVAKGTTRTDWESLLVVSDAKHRENDEFIEAHIYDSFNADSIEAIKVSSVISDKDAKLDAKICLERFSKTMVQRRKPS